MKKLVLSLLFPTIVLAINVPFLSGPVVDEAHLLSSVDTQTIEAQVRALKSKRGVQLSILITPSLEGHDIESYSMEVAEKWKLGKKKEDRGLLFIVAPNERRMRLEVGYGLEGEIPDAIAKRILRESTGPFFKKGKYAEGILAAIAQIDARIENPKVNLEEEEPPKPGIAQLIFFFLIFIVVLFMNFLRRAQYGSHYSNRRGGWPPYGGGGFGGGSWGGGGGGWSGGGGGFGGGGGSDSW